MQPTRHLARRRERERSGVAAVAGGLGPGSLQLWPWPWHVGRKGNNQLLETRKLLHCSPAPSSQPSCLFRRKELSVCKKWPTDPREPRGKHSFIPPITRGTGHHGGSPLPTLSKVAPEEDAAAHAEDQVDVQQGLHQGALLQGRDGELRAAAGLRSALAVHAAQPEQHPQGAGLPLLLLRPACRAQSQPSGRPGGGEGRAGPRRAFPHAVIRTI